MITRPMAPMPVMFTKGHSESALTPLDYTQSNGPHGGYPHPIIRTKSFAFGPRNLPPVNKIVGPPRIYG